jgi:hypothetical protein
LREDSSLWLLGGLATLLLGQAVLLTSQIQRLGAGAPSALAIGGVGATILVFIGVAAANLWGRPIRRRRQILAKRNPTSEASYLAIYLASDTLARIRAEVGHPHSIPLVTILEVDRLGFKLWGKDLGEPILASKWGDFAEVDFASVRINGALTAGIRISTSDNSGSVTLEFGATKAGLSPLIFASRTDRANQVAQLRQYAHDVGR